MIRGESRRSLRIPLSIMTNILTAAQAANFLRTQDDDPVMLLYIPLLDQYIENATGRDWTQDSPVNNLAIAAAGMLLVIWYDNPAQVQQGSESELPYGMTNLLAVLEAEAMKYRRYQFEGISGAGDIALPGALMGDDVISLTGVYNASGDQSSNFESEISDSGYIAQTSSADLTDQLFVVILKSPAADIVS